MKPKEDRSRLSRLENAVILLGNLNVGKTTIFHRLCRGKQYSFNYPGTSVSVSSARMTGTEYSLLDTPGIHSIFSLSEDESVARDTVLASAPRILVIVGDAKHLTRSLALLFQFAEYHIPMILNLNMMDEARQRGIYIDTERLARNLGIPVNPSVAVEGIGLRSLRRLMDEAKVCRNGVPLPEPAETYLRDFRTILDDPTLPARALGLQVLTDDPGTGSFLARNLDSERLSEIQGLAANTRRLFFQPPEVLLNQAYTRYAQRVAEEVQTVSPPAHMPFAERLGAWSRNVWTGIPIALLVLLAMYLVVGEFGAQFLVELIEGRLFGEIIVPFVQQLMEPLRFDILERAVTGEFGLLSVGLSLALGVVVPVLFTFFLAFGVIEDSGYLPRLSILMERLFRRMGLTGKGVLPIVMGFSCVTMAIMTTRILETRKERVIATVLLLLGLPCAPLLSVMLVVLTQLNWQAYVVVFGVITIQMFIIGLLAGRFLPGEQPIFFLEIPPLRIPRFKNILEKTIQRIIHFTSEAIPVFLFATFVLFVLDELGFLRLIERLGQPVLETLLGLPPESIRVVLSTMIRREAGAALLKDLFDHGVFNDVQTVLLLLLCTFLVPCVNAVLVTVKEHGLRTTVAIISVILPYALLAGMALHYIFTLTEITFR